MPALGTSPVGASGAPGASPGPRGKQGRVLPGATAAPSPFEGVRGRGKPGERSAETNSGGSAAGAAKVTPASRFQGGSAPSEHDRPPRRTLGEGASPGQGGAEQIPAEGRERAPQRQRFGTPAPAGTGEHGQRGGGPPSGFRQPVTPPSGGGPADEARGQKERTQGVHGQPPQRGGAPAGAEHGQGQGQLEGGKRKPEKGTPAPRPQ
jgi:hypothetical protein